MKKMVPLVLLAICSLGLFGCPYESTVPITHPSIPVDNRFVGSWSSEDETYNKYIVSVKSENEYHIVQKTIAGGVSKFTGFLSDVKGATFMNLFSDSTQSYYIYRIKIDPTGSKFTLMPISNKINEHFGSSDGLRSYVEKNMNFQSFYNNADNEEFIKSE